MRVEGELLWVESSACRYANTPPAVNMHVAATNRLSPEAWLGVWGVDKARGCWGFGYWVGLPKRGPIPAGTKMCTASPT